MFFVFVARVCMIQHKVHEKCARSFNTINLHICSGSMCVCVCVFAIYFVIEQQRKEKGIRAEHYGLHYILAAFTATATALPFK